MVNRRRWKRKIEPHELENRAAESVDRPMNSGDLASNDTAGQGTSSDGGGFPPAAPSAATLEPGTPSADRDLSICCWSVAAILLSFFGLTHLGVMLCFCLGARVPPFLAPVALLASLVIVDGLARGEGRRGRWRIAAPAVALAVAALALRLASAFFDMSWDGLWYHQTAVYQMSHGWNPLRDPQHNFAPHLQDWVRYYAKGPWYIALALFEMTHRIEWAKAAPWMGLAATFLAVFAAGLDFGRRRLTAVLIAALVALNPVVTCQLASYLVDGLMISFLACFVAASLRGFLRPSALMNWIALASAVLCINAKQTGLVYLCFFVAAGGLYVLLKRRDLLGRFVLVQSGAILLGAVLFGFNPYVTNTVHRGNPFYPWLGSAAHPSFAQRGQDPNELYETPKNMVGRSRLVRLSYALFSHPGPQTFLNGENACLMCPFNVRWNDFSVFRFHEVRLAGFGPLFSGAFLISLFLLGAALVRPGVPREVVVLLAATVVASLLVSVHTWWARYGPQLWWLPVIAVIAGLAVPGWRAARWTAGGLAALLLINAMLVGVALFQWEIAATRTTHEQMTFLRQQEGVEVNLQYFGEPFGERLRAAGVEFRATNRLQGDHPMELMSVVPGYPGAVRACFRAKPTSASTTTP